MSKRPPSPSDNHDTAPEAMRGEALIRSVLKTLPDSPGVYRMLDEQGVVLYVGKAKSLKKRVVAYTRPESLSLRLQRMVRETMSMDIVTTHTEAEALLLESNLIKKLKPRFNILLRDDKSFPYVVITSGHDFPRLVKHRGARDLPGEYFGPFASAGAVTETLSILQKAFLLRTCTDSVFANRSRPCLLHQIRRCCAPCVNHVEQSEYATLLDQARSFLSGRSTEIRQQLVQHMEAHAEALEFEQAARLRDRLKALSQVQAHQDINVEGLADADVIALYQAGGQTCIQVFFFRGGQNWGNRAYFPYHAFEDKSGAILEAFVGQFYATHQPPPLVLLSEDVLDHTTLEHALRLRCEHRVDVRIPRRGSKMKAVEHTLTNAREALGRRMAETSAQRTLLQEMATVFALPAPPERIEVYDNAHIQGTHAVGGMIVAGPEGFVRQAYRTFSIRGDNITPGDDFGMMREVLARRFRRGKAGDNEGSTYPDVILVDGGAGQMNAALGVLESLNINNVHLICIAKGPDRNAGRETYHQPGREPFTLPPSHPVHYFLQRLRDEAHRFANGTHRAKRSRAIGTSTLDNLPGIGPRRKKALLNAFGSARGIAAAGISDLSAVEGISQALAKKIYGYFHPGR
ncbi:MULTISPECIES: excinuclease ABC subunit UvrC [unclassified Haematospirillum]|uniref:excinuclease ABC subunit UvrC n=1 Tax=unclassified Haematospirillum TaxID=2622088 RepID=UPI001438B6E5|nr:excinuclease ABC subunit UvrC [Haematospirillum sp. H4890]NKD74829.1 excinuclease ABC subunit UvrC [Haematospirillum sp. H4485]